MQIHADILIDPATLPEPHDAGSDPLLRSAPVLPPRGPLPALATPDRAGLLGRLRQIQAVMTTMLQQEVGDDR